ncbi:MAG TPA: hypothetical protein VGC41_17255 [Kofleriaceae bacterium]
MECLYRRSWGADSLMRAHPLEVDHPNKKLVFERALRSPLAGTVEATRWTAAPLPGTFGASSAEPREGHYTYDGAPEVWHVNFADPELFFAYGSRLLAQDELQCAEHPILGCVREAMIADGHPALTEEGGRATPVLVRGAERRVAIDSRRIYGNAFAAASPELVRECTQPLDPAPRSNILAIAAPVGGGAYTREQITYALSAAYTGFAAAVHETAGAEIRTGFWGCGAFGGNRELMVAIQLAAARYAAVPRLVFYAFDDAGRADFERGAAVARELSAEHAITELLARDYRWGYGNGT